jgi:ABC-2 type transport system permease protein
MRAIFVLALKDLTLRSREPVGLFWTFGFPFVFALFFGAMFGGEGKSKPLEVALVNEDTSPAAEAFVARLNESDAISVKQVNLAEARDEVRLGKRTAYVRIPPGFGRASFFAPDAASLEVGIDPARKAESGLLQGVLMENVFRVMEAQFADPKEFQKRTKEMLQELDTGKGEMKRKDREILKHFLEEALKFSSTFDAGRAGGGPRQPVQLEIVGVTRDGSSPRSPYEITFPSSMMWAILGSVMSFALSIVFERNGGTWLRLQIAPVSRTQILAGKALASWLWCVAAAGTLLLAGHLLFGVRVENMLGMVMALASAAFCFTAIMMLLASLFRSEEALSGAGWGILVTAAMLGGGMIPLMVMPAWMQRLSDFSPVKWGILALEGAIWRGFSVGEMLLPCAILLGLGTVCFAAGIRVLRRGEG